MYNLIKIINYYTWDKKNIKFLLNHNKFGVCDFGMIKFEFYFIIITKSVESDQIISKIKKVHHPLLDSIKLNKNSLD